MILFSTCRSARPPFTVSWPVSRVCLWKLLGFVGGPHVLDVALISHSSQPDVAPSSGRCAGVFSRCRDQPDEEEGRCISLTVPVEGHTQLQSIEAFVKYVEIERTTDPDRQCPGSNSGQPTGLAGGARPYTAVGKANAAQLPGYEQARSSVHGRTVVGRNRC